VIQRYEDGLKHKDGGYVLYSDHLKEVEVLREALREALEGWYRHGVTATSYGEYERLLKVLSDLTP
jgi:hypothetical protein